MRVITCVFIFFVSILEAWAQIPGIPEPKLPIIKNLPPYPSLTKGKGWWERNNAVPTMRFDGSYTAIEKKWIANQGVKLGIEFGEKHEAGLFYGWWDPISSRRPFYLNPGVLEIDADSRAVLRVFQLYYEYTIPLTQGISMNFPTQFGIAKMKTWSRSNDIMDGTYDSLLLAHTRYPLFLTAGMYLEIKPISFVGVRLGAGLNFMPKPALRTPIQPTGPYLSVRLSIYLKKLYLALSEKKDI